MLPVLLSLGILYLLALGAGRISAALGIPRVTGYLAVGLPGVRVDEQGPPGRPGHGRKSRLWAVFFQQSGAPRGVCLDRNGSGGSL